jgi:hypothetical protein
VLQPGHDKNFPQASRPVAPVVSGGRLRRVAALLAAAFLVLSCRAAAAQNLAGPWVELGADNRLSVRVVVPSGVAACPRVVADGTPLEARQRGDADGDFAVTVCVADVPIATAALTLDGKPLPVLPAQINRVVVFGDTGCRIEGRALQDCNDPNRWPFPVIAKRAADRKPDLAIHVGDYYYRESACPAGQTGCAGSPHGDNWTTWNADFFAPAAPLLAVAPWVMVRGNHELCTRGGKGWSRLLDPHRDPLRCAARTEPYRLHFGGLDLLLFDDADADDFSAPTDKVAAYAAQLAPLLADAPPHAWLLLHRPIWAMAQSQLGGITANQTMEAAIRAQVPPGLDLVLSGHLHDFLSYEFGPERPAQLVVGTGGDTLLPLGQAPIVGAEIDGMTVSRGFASERFGYFIMEREADGWAGTLYAPDDTVLARCRLAGRTVGCR